MAPARAEELSPSELAAALSDAVLGLAAAADDAPRTLAALAPTLPGVASLELVRLRAGEAEAPAAWTAPGVAAALPAGASRSAAALAASWPADGAPRLVADLADAGAPIPDDLRAALLAAGRRALAVLPLRGGELPARHGLLFVTWSQVHVLRDTQVAALRLAAHALAGHLSARALLAAHRDALAEARALQEASAALSAARTPADALAAVARPTLAAGASRASLWTFELDAAGEPDTAVLVAGHGATFPGAAPIGARLPVAGLPLTELWRRAPHAPTLIPDAGGDPHIDPRTREIFRRADVRAAAFLPLHWRGRWLGVASLQWPAPTPFTPALRRLLGALTRPLAAVFDSRLLLQAARAAEAELRAQRALLDDLVERLPVGVVLGDPIARTVRYANAEAARLHGLPRAPAERPGDPTSLAALGEIVTYLPGTDEVVPVDERPMISSVRGGRPVRRECDLQRADGSRVPIVVTAAPIAGDEGRVERVVLVLQDLGARRAAERERGQMQDALIRVQAEALRERDVPILRLRDDRIVVPLIGGLDRARGEQLLRRLAAIPPDARLRAALLDVTGVPAIDVEAATSLVRAAAALRLRGIAPVLTGIRPDLAAALVDLGVELGGLVVRRALHDGLAYADALR